MILEAFMMERLGLGARPPRWKAGRGPRAQACSRSKLLRPVECLKSSEAPQRRAAKVMAGQCLQWAFGMLWMLSQTGRALMAPEKKRRAWWVGVQAPACELGKMHRTKPRSLDSRDAAAAPLDDHQGGHAT